MNRLITFSLLFLLLVNAFRAEAEITTIALSIDDVPGITGAEFGTFGAAKINAAGNTAFVANLTDGVGGISAANDLTLLLFDGTNVAAIAREGSGNVPDAVGANFANFTHFALDDSGNLLTRATLSTNVGGVTTDNNQGVWSFANGADSSIARTGSGDVPDLEEVNFASLSFQFNATGNGQLALGGVVVSEGLVTSENNGGIWKYQNGEGSLEVREGISAVPGVPFATFDSFATSAINENGQLAFKANLKTVGNITTANRTGIWKYDGAGQLLARTGVGNVPGAVGLDFNAFNDPLINEAGQVAFRAQLNNSQEGLWRFINSIGENLALNNVSNAPGVPDAVFASFSEPLFGEAGYVVTLATIYGEGVTSSNSSGIWVFDGPGGDQLLVRKGSGSVPDLSGANFDSIEYFAATSDGILVQATLEVGAGEVTTEDNQGIWHVPFTGDPELLLRKGEQLAGRTIAALTFPTSVGMGSPLRGVSNDFGQFVFRADFTNGDSGLFLYSPDSSTEFAPADFNTDGFVDGDDLAMWQGAYGTTSAGDADNDDDTDGRDFLSWQRQYTGSAPALAVVVPEPGVSLLVATALLIALVRTRG